MITYKLLDEYSKIAHFCTTREGGVSVGNYASLNLSPFSGDDYANFKANQIKLGEELGIDSNKIIIPYQTHGTEIKEIDNAFFELTEEDKKKYLHSVDALFTRIPKICLGITTADCVPILIYDPIKHIIAAVHAGWRGTCAHIAEKTVQILMDKYDCQPTDFRVVIGPSISSEVYEVGKEVVENFETEGFNISEIATSQNNTYYLDLWKANQQSLVKMGILKDHIEIAGICTFTEHERFFSARRLGLKSGRILSGIMLKK